MNLVSSVEPRRFVLTHREPGSSQLGGDARWEVDLANIARWTAMSTFERLEGSQL